MNFGPLEFADYLRRKDEGRAGEPATVTAARAAAPAPAPLDGRLTVISAGSRLAPSAERDPGDDSQL